MRDSAVGMRGGRQHAVGVRGGRDAVGVRGLKQHAGGMRGHAGGDVRGSWAGPVPTCPFMLPLLFPLAVLHQHTVTPVTMPARGHTCDYASTWSHCHTHDYASMLSHL